MRSVFVFCSCTLITVDGSSAQDNVAQLTERFIGMTAVAGFEQVMADSLLDVLPAAQRDRAGNVVLTLGDGTPTRAVVCPMDEWGYVVGGVHEDGYVTVRRVGRGAPAQFDQMHAAKRMIIWGRNGPVPAVVGIPSTHLRRGRGDASDRLFASDDIYLDLGTNSPDEVAKIGVEVLNPIAMEKNVHSYGESLVSGPEAGQRAGCAALVAAVTDSPRTVGTVVVAFTVESRIGHRGIATLANGYGPFHATLLVEYPLGRRTPSGLGEMTQLNVATRYDGWPVETVDLTDVDSVMRGVREWLEAVQ